MMRNPITIAILSLVSTGCLFQEPVDSLTDHPGIHFSDRKSIELVNRSLEIYVEDTAALAKSGNIPRTKVTDFDYIATHVARIRPVSVGGDSVQANDIVIHGTTAIIAYNYAGDRFAGALQIVDIAKAGSPEIEQEIIFDKSDLNALYTDGNRVVFGGAADPESNEYRSFISFFDLSSPDLSALYANIMAMPSYAVTGISGSGSQWFASCGAKDGAVVLFDKAPSPEDTITLQDARDVAAYQDGLCALYGTTDNDLPAGGVSVYDPDGTFRYGHTIDDFESEYHKATIEIVNGTHALLGLSEAGCKIMSLQTGEFIHEIDNPVAASGTVVTNCNSASADGNLLFTANGNFGFQVFTTGADFATVTRIGFAPFDELLVGDQYYSANHVAFKGSYLFVASGVGGVNIYTFDKK